MHRVFRHWALVVGHWSFRALGAAALLPLALSAAETRRFNFALTTHAYADAPLVAQDQRYTPAAGFGFLPAATPDSPLLFVVDLPEGNYEVTVTLGADDRAGDTTIKAETRRLLLESVRTAPGQLLTRSFTVNVRSPAIAGAPRSVGLKETERGIANWDDTLTLEFNGASPAVASLAITRNDAALTVYLAGDSTVTDQPGEPWAAWGQMLPRFFGPGVAVANHAWSGLSLASFRGSRRLEKILSTLRPGDYVFLQFGHNDQKEKGEGVGAFTTYAQSLRDYVSAIRETGGRPVLLTSMYRRRFDERGKLYDTLGDFPPAVRQVAQETRTPLIDLHAMSARLLAALGPEASKAAFVHFPAGAHGSEKAVKDDTHFSPYGAYELARCVVEGIRAELPELAAHLAPDAGRYDPSRPGDPASFALPPSPPRDAPRMPAGDGR